MTPGSAQLDTFLQGQVDGQLLEQGAFTPLEWLFESGRLVYDDYERWRRGELEFLDDVLMGSRDNIRAELESAAHYARAIGLVEEAQEFHGWHTGPGGAPQPASATGRADASLRISADPKLRQLIGSRYVPAQKAPQMDLFFDNPVVALTSGLVRCLSTHHRTEAQRLLDGLYAQAPNHADLPAFDQMLAALGRLGETAADTQEELDFLLRITPMARRVLGSHSRDLLSPLWRRLAESLRNVPFRPECPLLHRSFALSQAQDWPGVTRSALEEPAWWNHPALCLRLTESAFHRRRRIEALTGWCHLCWRAPEQVEDALAKLRQTELSVLWQRFTDAQDEDEPDAGNGATHAVSLTPQDFPAFLLLTEPGLAQQLPADLPRGTTPGEESYRIVHRWIQARRANRSNEEIGLRKALHATHLALFRVLKRSVG